MQGQKSFEVRWHPFFLNPDASKEGVNKMEMYNQKFGEQRVKQMVPMMTVCQSKPKQCTHCGLMLCFAFFVQKDDAGQA